MLILPPLKKPKIGQNNPENRQTLSFATASKKIDYHFFGKCSTENVPFSKGFDMIQKSMRTLGYFATLFAFGSLFGAEPPPPPAGVVERQLEQEYDVEAFEAEKESPVIEIDLPSQELEDTGDSFFVKKIVFTGAESVSYSRLEVIAEAFEGKELSLKEINKLCRQVEAYYRKEGFFLTRVYPPAQEVTEGVLSITVVEGKLGEITVTGNHHYTTKFIQSYFLPYKGRTIHYGKILKALLLLDENLDLKSGVVFKKGVAVGTADLVVRVEDKKPIHLTIDYNNYGSLLTSRSRTGVRLDWGNLFLNGDRFTLVEVVGSPISSLDFTNAAYHFPITVQGAAIDLSYLFADFKTARNADDVKFTGRSHIATVKFSQAVVRKEAFSATIFTAFDYKQIQNISGGSESSDDKLRVLTGGVDLDLVDALRGRNLLNLFGSWGIPKVLGGLKGTDSESSREGAGGRFVHLNGGYQRVQKFPFDTFLVLNGVGQYSFNKLPLPEQIYIGGVDTVRGYKLAEGIGDSGFYCNIELRAPPPFIRKWRVPGMKKSWGEFLQFVGFIDHGQVFSRGSNEVETVSYSDEVLLTSVGAGVRLYGPWLFEISFDAGYPITHRNRSSTTICYLRIALKAL